MMAGMLHAPTRVFVRLPMHFMQYSLFFLSYALLVVYHGSEIGFGMYMFCVILFLIGALYVVLITEK